MSMEKRDFGKIHDYAQCKDCNWDYPSIDGHRRKNIYYHIKKHVKETGHTIQRETGTSVDYYPTPLCQHNKKNILQ